MILHLPGLIATLAELVGTKHRNRLRVEVNSLDDVLAINDKIYDAWRKYSNDPRKQSIRKSMTIALHTMYVAEILLTQEQDDGK